MQSNPPQSGTPDTFRNLPGSVVNPGEGGDKLYTVRDFEAVPNFYEAIQDEPTSETFRSLLPVRRHFEAALTQRGDWNTSIYDLAWVLCCDFFSDEEKGHYIQQLQQAQKPDGTWGDASYIPHSALVDTLAVIVAFLRLGEPIARLKLLMKSVDRLLAEVRSYSHHDTVAFELIVPLMVLWIEEHGLRFDISPESRKFIDHRSIQGIRKLKLAEEHGGLFNPTASLSFTAEFAALIPLQETQIDQLASMMLPNGAIGLSPAATAAFILALREHGREVPDGLYDYLRSTFKAYDSVGFPNLHPAWQTRQLWNILPWMLSGNLADILRDAGIRDLMKKVYLDIQPDDQGRVSWDSWNSMLPDLDDTSVAHALWVALQQAGVHDLAPRSPQVFRLFQREDGRFFCYPNEMHPSPASKLHALMAMSMSMAVFGPQPGDQALIDDLLHDLNPAGKTIDELCHDKWHGSWTYGAQRWLSSPLALQAYPETFTLIVDAVLYRQNDGGGWGQQEPTAEETAYIISGLAKCLRSSYLPSPEKQADVRRALQYAVAFLETELSYRPLRVAPIWISKNVYFPLHQTLSAILDARFSLIKLSQQ